MDYISFNLESFKNYRDFPMIIEYGFHNTDMFLHDHSNFYELTIILSGSATHIVNNERYTIHKGDVFVVGRDIVHGFENPSNFKLCNIMYKPEILLNTTHDIQESAGFHSLFVLEPYLSKNSHFTSHLQLPIPIFEVTNGLISMLVQEYNSENIGRTTMLQALFWNLVVLLARAYQVEEHHKDSFLNIAVPLAYINQNYRETITVTELASMAHMSERNFTRVFHKAYGMSPSNYIIQLRIQHAYELLQNTEFSILEVAYMCGFRDSSYFTRQFKQASGFTPREYRSRLEEFRTTKKQS
ncbi:AraC family transcriptional regulator [Anaerosporobacter sp.]|uniref:AraC family transcriptional regulator n=1 Tax=Anaerosporobacter sp. TaxID=1872529 RepID=UPI00286F80CF|nr:AraC family transcriptional regulator [Anaerosporobacter sp.]